MSEYAYTMYFVLGYSGGATLEQWGQFGGELVNNQPFFSWLQRRGIDANERLSFHKLSQGVGNIGKFCLVGVEVEVRNRDAVIAAVNDRAGELGISGNMAAKLSGIMLAEMKQAALDLGYSQTVANRFSVPALHFGPDREAVQETARQYLRDNAGVWYV